MKNINELRPVSIREIKAFDAGWTVTQKFEKLGYPVTIYVWGFTRDEALSKFEQEKIYAAQPEADLLEEFANWIMGKNIY